MTPTARISPSRALGLLLRSKVAGDDAARLRAEIWDTPGPRWFGRGEPICRVHEHAAMYPGGIASLLLQSLHPSAMAGVAGHSGYRSDPWGRLQRTSYYIAATTFGTIDLAEETIAHVRSIHERVRGKDHRGRPYAASDPHLLRWVHVAEISTFLAAHQTYSPTPLTAPEADHYVDQTRVAAERLGATGLPRTVGELETALAAYSPELEVSPAARDAADFLLHEPPLPAIARPGYALVARGGVALLPDHARTALGLDTGPLRHRADHAAGLLATRVIRRALAAIPAEDPSPEDPSPEDPPGEDRSAA
ncbi:oxygenase MpaB family protein [Actinomycetota bacterium]